MIMLLLCLPPVAEADVTQSDSADFPLNTVDTTPGIGGIGRADSADFTLDTTNPTPGAGGIAIADSADFTLDTTNPTPGVGGIAIADSADFTLDTTNPTLGAGGIAIADSADFTLDTLGVVVSSEIAVTGNNVDIADGDTSPSVTDDTDFGSAEVNSGSVFHTFVIHNTGTNDLALGPVSFSGAHAGDFLVPSPPMSPVAPGGTAVVFVYFSPTGTGLRSAVLSFTNNDGDESPFTFSIQGTGTLPTAGAGTLDTLDININGEVLATAVQPDGKIILAGNFTEVSGVARAGIARLNALGTVDMGFNPNPNDNVSCVAVQSDGKVLLGGSFNALQPNGAPTPTTRNHIARVNADGSLDTGFDPNANFAVQCLVVQPDGKVLLGGNFGTLRPNGAGAATTRIGCARVNADGTLDTGFDPNPNNIVRCLALQTDGSVLIGGTFTQLQPNGAPVATTRHRLARVTSLGALDTSFAPNPDHNVSCVAVQADGKVLLAGMFTSLQFAGSPSFRHYIARVNGDGSLDTGFNPDANDWVDTLALQTDGKVLLGGVFTTVEGTARNRIARVNADGTLDTAFDPKANGNVRSIAVQADGKVLIGGAFATLQPNGAAAPTARNWFARLLNDSVTQTLATTSSSRVEWMRVGAGPETPDVTFELSTDGGTLYTALGVGTRITGGWELTGLTLPTSGHLRARARTSGGQYTGSAGLVEQVESFAPAPAPAPSSQLARRSKPASVSMPSAPTPVAHSVARPIIAESIPEPVPTTLALKGMADFAGLVMDPSDRVPRSVEHGFIRASVSQTTGAFSASLRINGQTHPIIGSLDALGTALFGTKCTPTLTLSNADGSRYLLSFHASADLVTGSLQHVLADGHGTPAVALHLDPACSAVNPVPARLAQAYALRFVTKGDLDPATAMIAPPPGEGAGLLRVSTAGIASGSGVLADGSAVTFSTRLSVNHLIPFYSSAATGSLIGWATLTDTPSGPVIHGPVSAATADRAAYLLWFLPVRPTSASPLGREQSLSIGLQGDRAAGPTQ